jgi:hypothetical protein
MKKLFRAGIKLGIFILTAGCTVEITRLGWNAFQSRTGAPGGELLIFPMIILLFYAGWVASKEWEGFKASKKEGVECQHQAKIGL